MDNQKKATSKKSTTNKEAFLEKATASKGPKSSLQRGLLKQQEDIKNLREMLKGQEEVFVYNATPGAFHLAPTNADALKHEETAHKFDLGEIRVFKSSDIFEHKDFLKAIAENKLQIKTDEEVSEIELQKERALKKSNKTGSSAGIHKSGLSNNIKAAIGQIWDIDDIDLLDEYRELEDRAVIIEAIDTRISEIEEEG